MPRQDGEGYTRFGWYLNELMRRHYIRRQHELARIVTGAGYPIQQPAISKIMRGESETRSAFLVALADALELSAGERSELAEKASFVQADKRRHTWEKNMRQMRDQKDS
jgi:hypothetical protein